MVGLRGGKNCSAVLTEYMRVTDGQTACDSIVRGVHTRHAVMIGQLFSNVTSNKNIAHVIKICPPRYAVGESISLRQVMTGQ